jgi:hypothetical protein
MFEPLNFSPKLVRIHPYIVENRGITIAPLFLGLISWKSPPQSIKIFVKLDFFTNVLVVCFVFVYTESYWEQLLIAPEKKLYFGFDSSKNVNFKLIGEDFFMISISKIMVPLYCVDQQCCPGGNVWRPPRDTPRGIWIFLAKSLVIPAIYTKFKLIAHKGEQLSQIWMPTIDSFWRFSR